MVQLVVILLLLGLCRSSSTSLLLGSQEENFSPTPGQTETREVLSSRTTQRISRTSVQNQNIFSFKWTGIRTISRCILFWKIKVCSSFQNKSLEFLFVKKASGCGVISTSTDLDSISLGRWKLWDVVWYLASSRLSSAPLWRFAPSPCRRRSLGTGSSRCPRTAGPQLKTHRGQRSSA